MKITKVADDSQAAFSGASAVEVPPCPLQTAETSGNGACNFSVKSIFQGRVVFITGWPWDAYDIPDVPHGHTPLGGTYKSLSRNKDMFRHMHLCEGRIKGKESPPG